MDQPESRSGTLLVIWVTENDRKIKGPTVAVHFRTASILQLEVSPLYTTNWQIFKCAESTIKILSRGWILPAFFDFCQYQKEIRSEQLEMF